MHLGTFIGFGIFVPITMLPVMLHLWLRAGTGNANYFYFQGLAYNVFMALGVLQFIAGAERRRKALAIEASKQQKGLAVDEKRKKEQ